MSMWVSTCTDSWGWETYAIVSVVRPCVTRSKAPWISLSVRESSDAVASSSSRMGESFNIARAMATFRIGQQRARLSCITIHLHVDAPLQRV